MCSRRGGAAMALMRMLILLGLLVCSHADIPSVPSKEHPLGTPGRDQSSEGEVKNEWVVTIPQNALEFTEPDINNAGNGEVVLESGPTMATGQQPNTTTTLLNGNNNGDPTSPVGNNNNRGSPSWLTRVIRFLPTPHVTGLLPQYWTASHRGIAGTASTSGIFTPNGVVGKLAFWWGKTVLTLFLITLQWKDFAIIALIFICLYFRKNYWSTISYPSHMLFFATNCVVYGVLSAIWLASHPFGEETRNLTSNGFCAVALVDALVNLASIAYYYVGLMIRPFDNESEE